MVAPTTTSNRPTGALLRTLCPPGTWVRVYRNLRPGVPPWSVMHYGHAGTKKHQWRVAGHASELLLTGVTFRVYEAGRQRVLRTGVKNVHSFVQGQLLTVDEEGAPPMPTTGVVQVERVSYNPRLYRSFVLAEAPETGVMRATAVWLTGEGKLYAMGPEAR